MSAASVVIPFPSFVLPERNQPLNFQQMDRAVRAAIKTALDQAHNLTSTAKRIWLYCSGLTSRNGDYAFPHHATIAEKLGISKKTVQRALKNLADSGWLKYEPGAGLRGNKLWLMLPISLGEQLDKTTTSIDEQLDRMTSPTGQNDQLNRTNCPVDINSPIEPFFNQTTASEQPKNSGPMLVAALPSQKINLEAKPTVTGNTTDTNTIRPRTPEVAFASEAEKSWVLAAFRLHPKKLGDKSVAFESLQSVYRDSESRRFFDVNHPLWCKTKQWLKENYRYCPRLPAFIESEQYLDPPTECDHSVNDGYYEVPEL
jgi:predicted transcriptional regulator